MRLAAEAAFERFREDPTHPSLHTKPIAGTCSGRVKSGTYSVRVTRSYRALFTRGADGAYLWYWIGSHADYDQLLGR